jgi:hypothetical protein
MPSSPEMPTSRGRMRRWRRPTWRSAKRRAHCRGRRVDPNLGPIVFAIPLIALGFLSWPTQGLLMSGLAITAQQREKISSRAI